MRKGLELSLTMLCLITVLASGSIAYAPVSSTIILGSQTQTFSPYYTHWYAGSVYPPGSPTQNASEIETTIKVPSTAPRPDEFYYVLLSAWDSNGSYDQIGFTDNYGTWALTCSWTTGPPSSLNFHYPSSLNEMIPMTQGATYRFWISFWTGNGVALFGVDQETPQGGFTPFWSSNATTGGNCLVLSYMYSGYFGYTDYEEVWVTHISGGSPNFDFYFSNNSWVALNHTTYATSWTQLFIYSVPSNVAVQVNGSAVLVDNDYGYGPSPTIDQPPPLSVSFGQHEGDITWHPYCQMPDQYSISVNGASPTFYVWYGGTITYSVDGWPKGSYEVTCTVYDKDGRSVSSTVSVTINGLPLSIVAAVSACAVVVAVIAVAVIVSKRQRRPKASASQNLAEGWIQNSTVVSRTSLGSKRPNWQGQSRLITKSCSTT